MNKDEKIMENKTEATSKLDSATATYKRMGTKQRKIFNAVFIIVFLLIFVGLNVLSVFLVQRFPSLEVDLTRSGAYTLQDTTEEHLNSLSEPISIKVLKTEDELLAFADDNGSTAYSHQVNQLLREMSEYKNIEVEYLDVAGLPTKELTEKYPDIDWSSAENMVLVENSDGTKYELLTSGEVFTFDSTYAYYYGQNVISGQNIEQEVLTSIQKITSERIVKVALSVGNGELVNSESKAYQYFSYIPAILEDNAYEIETVNLLTQTPPEDADILMMISPSYDLTDTAAEGLAKWIENGGEYGKTFFFVPYDYADDTPNIDLFLEQWGMKVTDGYINETDMTRTVSTKNPPELNGMVDYADDTYTKELKTANRPVLMPFCMPVEITDAEMATPLLISSDSASVRLIPEDADADAEYIDSTGTPLNAAAISKKTNTAEKASNVIVWGSYESLGVENLFYYSANYGNAGYFVNLLNTVSDNEVEGIVIEGVSLGSDTIAVTSAHKVAVFVIFVFIIPIAVFVTGIIIWVRRRNR